MIQFLSCSYESKASLGCVTIWEISRWVKISRVLFSKHWRHSYFLFLVPQNILPLSWRQAQRPGDCNSCVLTYNISIISTTNATATWHLQTFFLSCPQAAQLSIELFYWKRCCCSSSWDLFKGSARETEIKDPSSRRDSNPQPHEFFCSPRCARYLYLCFLTLNMKRLTSVILQNLLWLKAYFRNKLNQNVRSLRSLVSTRYYHARFISKAFLRNWTA